MKYPTALQALEQLAGPEEAPKGINEKIGISERGKVRTWSALQRDETVSGKVKRYNLILSG